MKSDMKRTIIFSLIVGALTFSGVSCMKIDNFDAPESQFSGRIIDSTTGKPILASQGHGNVRLWEKSFSNNPDPQDIPLKQDGSFNNIRLFPGTYDVLPYGPWWPCDTVRNVGIGRSATRDFEVTPYLTLLDFEARLEGTTLYMSCRLDAPRGDDPDMPMILDARPYVSFNQFCGPGQHGNIGNLYARGEYYTLINKLWKNLAKDDDGKSTRIHLPAIELKAGYYYTVRMGVKVNDAHQNFNLTEIKEITVPR